MDADERAPSLPLKRRHSSSDSRSPPSDRPIAPLPRSTRAGSPSPTLASSKKDSAAEPPTKRLRRIRGVPEYEPGRVATVHPRRAQKMNTKRAKKAERRAAARAAKGMQVDEDGEAESELAFTFMASPDGMVNM